MLTLSIALVHNLSRPLFLTNIGPAKTGPTGPVAPALRRCGKVSLCHHLSTHLKACPYSNVKCPFNIVVCKSEVKLSKICRNIFASLSKHFEMTISSVESNSIYDKVMAKVTQQLEQEEKKFEEIQKSITE